MRPNVQAALRGFKGGVGGDALPGPLRFGDGLRHGPRCPREQSAVLVCQGIDRDQLSLS